MFLLASHIFTEQYIVATHKPRNTHQCSKGDDLEYTLHGEEGSKHYVQVG